MTAKPYDAKLHGMATLAVSCPLDIDYAPIIGKIVSLIRSTRDLANASARAAITGWVF